MSSVLKACKGIKALSYGILAHSLATKHTCTWLTLRGDGYNGLQAFRQMLLALYGEL
ncbi:hypothetical protein Csa_022723 [Cucumis sativus]|uniref:Uncharacterized protein n=1 Tax=Cucumis sativus TaxID=3659 RepID=A0A0A0LVR2_CUCSA|nr:hypothetical protein Csa_022723 [Cucumis sativus]